MPRHFKKSGLVLALLAAFLPSLHAEKIVLEYWDKWTGPDGESMRKIADDFNASQNRIEVRYTAISQLDVKLMLAIAGRKPPDIAGLWASRMANFVENNALLPLDVRAQKAGIRKEDYLPAVWDLCHYRGYMWALPTTPYDLALCWNKRIFREAGLDPERPPRTIAEMEEYNKKLVRPNPDGLSYDAFGHFPMAPGVWGTAWGFWFGGRLWNGVDKLTATDAGNLRALKWVESYPKRYGAHQVSVFLEGSSSSPSSVTLDPFLQGRIAMEITGPWISNTIRQFAPQGFELGAGAFPSETGEGPPVTLVDTDILTIPNGSPHPKEAFEFICFANRQDEMEKFCLSHCQFSPLVKVSDAFWKNHGNPCIKTFHALAQSPNAHPVPQMTIWPEYDGEFEQAIHEVWGLRLTPEQALQEVQDRMQPKLDRSLDRWKHISGKLEKIWNEEENEP